MLAMVGQVPGVNEYIINVDQWMNPWNPGS